MMNEGLCWIAIYIKAILLSIIPLQEIVILCLLLLLVIYSISMFINNWSRNYRDITQPAYIVASEETEEEQDPEAAHLTASKILSRLSRLSSNFQFSLNIWLFFLVLPWDHDEDLSLAESRMSKLSQVVQVSQYTGWFPTIFTREGGVTGLVCGYLGSLKKSVCRVSTKVSEKNKCPP